MIQKFLLLSIASLFILSISHCTKKETDKPIFSEEKVKQENVDKSLDLASRELGKLIDQVSDRNLGDLNDIQKLIFTFEGSDDDYDKYELCHVLKMAFLGYSLHVEIQGKKSALSDKELGGIKNAEKYCEERDKLVSDFEDTITNQEWMEIAKSAEESYLAHTKSLFSQNKRCTQSEYAKLLEVDSKSYRNQNVLSSILVYLNLKENGNIRDYAPKFKELVAKKKPKNSKFLIKYFTNVAEQAVSPATIDRRRDEIQKAKTLISKIGIKDITQFINQSVKIAPNCFSSIQSGLMDVSQAVK